MNTTQKFFKLPYQKVAEKLHDPFKPDRYYTKLNQSQMAMIEGLEQYRFWVHISARRTGKSAAAAILALTKMLEPYQQVMVVAPNYKLSAIIWEYVSNFVLQLGLEVERFNSKEYILVLKNGSTFRLLSAVNRAGLVGRAANLLIIDEAAVIADDEYFVRDLRPTLSTYEDSRALFITTPRGKANYTYQYFLRGQPEKHDEFPDWGSALYTWEANSKEVGGVLSPKDIEEAKKSMNSLALFKQEFYCEWTVFEGQIYEIDPEKHVKNILEEEPCIEPKDPRFDFVAGLDMGYRDESAFIVMAYNGDTWYIVDEYIAKETPTPVMAEIINEKIDYWGIENIYIDSAAQQTKADLAYEYDIYCDNAIKSVNDGIAFLQGLVSQDKIICDVTVPKCFSALAAYKWKTNTERQRPDHDWSSHPCDAIRYCIYSHSKNTVGIYSDAPY